MVYDAAKLREELEVTSRMPHAMIYLDSETFLSLGLAGV